MNQHLNPNTLSPRKTDYLKMIEKNHLGHFVFLPRKLGFDIREINGVTVINCGLKTSMFNIVYGSPRSVEISDSINKIRKIINDQSFAWWVGETDHSPQLSQALLNSGLTIDTSEHAMMCDLRGHTFFPKKTGLTIYPVTDKFLLADFLKVLAVYDSHVGQF